MSVPIIDESMSMHLARDTNVWEDSEVREEMASPVNTSRIYDHFNICTMWLTDILNLIILRMWFWLTVLLYMHVVYIKQFLYYYCNSASLFKNMLCFDCLKAKFVYFFKYLKCIHIDTVHHSHIHTQNLHIKFL